MTVRSRGVIAILFATALWTSLPRMFQASMDATRQMPHGYEHRRAQVLGPFHVSVQRIRATLRDGEAVGISLAQPERDMGAAVFANYELYPHPTRFYASLDDYRRDAHDPLQPKKLVRIDLGRTGEARLLSYLDVRHEEVSASPVIRELNASAEAHREWIVPMALAIDGAPGNAYLTDGVLVSDADTTATVTFFPSNESKTFALRAREPLIVRDVVYAITSRLEVGWLRVTSPVPLGAGFWFVNRGAKHAVQLPLFSRVPQSPQRVAGGKKLWILNPSDRAITVVVNGAPLPIAPRALATLGSAAENVITSSEPFLAFSARTENEREIFQWP